MYNADIERPTTYIPQRHLRGFSHRLTTPYGLSDTTLSDILKEVK